jgi:transposase
MQLQLYGKQIWVYKQAIDFRSSIDGLCSLIQKELQHNPQGGIYLFYNRHQDKLKCLSYHKNGFVLLYKRLDQGKFKFAFNKGQGICEIGTEELSWLLAGLEWQKMRQWKELDYSKFD